jgi:hypothetical protein
MSRLAHCHLASVNHSKQLVVLGLQDEIRRNAEFRYDLVGSGAGERVTMIPNRVRTGKHQRLPKSSTVGHRAESRRYRDKQSAHNHPLGTERGGSLADPNAADAGGLPRAANFHHKEGRMKAHMIQCMLACHLLISIKKTLMDKDVPALWAMVREGPKTN